MKTDERRERCYHSIDEVCANCDGVTPAYDLAPQSAVARRLWLWKNFVDGRPEYWAFDNPYPCQPSGDPMTLGEPCGYAIVKESARGRKDVTDDQVIEAIKRSIARSAIGPSIIERSGLRMPPGILTRLIGYANFSRCDLTSEDARFLAGLIQELWPSSNATDRSSAKS